ncbi:MAG: hypothetical protein Q8L37_05220 [Candidatus Gottesmanbacteria bacterium]|nr:hypothetical protein [Candidatus Gottesmanbacteria bacterium]
MESGEVAPAIQDHKRSHVERGTTAAITIYESEQQAFDQYKGVPGFFEVKEYEAPYWDVLEE